MLLVIQVVLPCWVMRPWVSVLQVISSITKYQPLLLQLRRQHDKRQQLLHVQQLLELLQEQQLPEPHQEQLLIQLLEPTPQLEPLRNHRRTLGRLGQQLVKPLELLGKLPELLSNHQLEQRVIPLLELLRKLQRTLGQLGQQLVKQLELLDKLPELLNNRQQ